MFIGQQELIDTIYSYKVNTLPNAILFLGNMGSGRHTISNMLAKNIGCPLVDITESLDLDTLMEIRMKSYVSCYLVDLDKIDVKKQNILLKSLEDTGVACKFILIATPTTNVLDTIVNRCQVIKFKPYTSDELSAFLPPNKEDFDEEDLNILKECFDTPGLLLNYGVDIKLVKNLATKLIYSKQTLSNSFVLTKLVSDRESLEKIIRYIIHRDVLSNLDKVDYFTELLSTIDREKDNPFENLLVSIYNVKAKYLK